MISLFPCWGYVIVSWRVVTLCLFFCLVFFVCGWWWFRLRDTLCFFIVIVLEILFHDVLPWKPTLSPEKWLEDNPFLLKCSLLGDTLVFFFSGPLASLAERKWSSYFPPLREPKRIEKASRLLGPRFFLLIALGVEENPSNYPKKIHFDKTQKSPKEKSLGMASPKKSHFDYINPENPRNKKKHLQKIHGCFLKWWVSPTTLGFPTQSRSLLGWRLRVPPYGCFRK